MHILPLKPDVHIQEDGKLFFHRIHSILFEVLELFFLFVIGASRNLSQGLQQYGMDILLILKILQDYQQLVLAFPHGLWV